MTRGLLRTLCSILGIVVLLGTIDNDSLFAAPQRRRNSVDTLKSIGGQSAFISFKVGKYNIDTKIDNNAQELENLDIFIQKLLKNKNSVIKSIRIAGYGSVDGSYKSNEILAYNRANSLKKYLDNKHNLSSYYALEVVSIAEDWNGFIDIVSSSDDPYKQQMLDIIYKYENPDKREAALKRLAKGAPWKRMLTLAQKTRRTDVMLMVEEYYYQIRKATKIEDIKRFEFPDTISSPYLNRELSIFTPKVEHIAAQIDTTKGMFPIALKTNLLFDLATLVNAELEIPIATHWSIAAEWMFPWWLTKDNKYCLEILSGTLEGRYWFGNRERMLGGFFTGIYASAGLYDIQYQTKGYQGEFYIAAGITGGYSVRLSKSLNMEFSIGLGYLQTDYNYYIPKLDYTILDYQDTRRWTWIGPTKAKISLVWLMGTKNYGKRVK